MQPLDEWLITPGKILVNERDRAALIALGSVGRRRGRSIDTQGFHLIRLDEEGLIAEGWGFPEPSSPTRLRACELFRWDATDVGEAVEVQID
jgi:hypothetical protein